MHSHTKQTGEGVDERHGSVVHSKLALDSTNFEPFSLQDPVPLGRQILAARGLRPPEAYSLYMILADGEFEDIRPDETIDLRAKGVERFIAFSSDRVFRATLNGHAIVWGDATIPEGALRVLAGIDLSEAVFLEVRGGTDRLIGAGEGVDLSGSGVESFITAAKPRVYVFLVSGNRYETTQSELTGLQIKARVTNWDPTHDLVLEGHGDEPDLIVADDTSVRLDVEPGPRRFSPAPKANFG